MITRLPEDVLIEVFRMLEIADIIRVQRVSKYFFTLFREVPMVLFNSLRGIYESPFFPSHVKPTYQGVKRLFARIFHSKIMMLEMLSYYTNGGYSRADPYESMINVFSSNLFDSCYSALKNQNILLKALFCGGKFNYSINRGKWEKQGLRDLKGEENTEIELFDLKNKLETVLRNTCKDIEITGFCIEKPSWTNKSSFRTCMMFSSRDNADTSEILPFFHSATDSNLVLSIANSLNIPAEKRDFEDYSIVFFKKSVFEVRPLCWIQFSNRNIGTDVMHVELLQASLGCYLYILFIDGFDSRSPSMDIGTFITKGKILQLYE